MSLNQIELNAVLYYADVLSLIDTNTTVTDNCKYFFVFGVPMNASFIVDSKPFYNPENEYFQQSCTEYNILKEKYGDEGVLSFINNICNISVCGCVDAIRMLKCIHQYDESYEKKAALNHYYRWKKGLSYKLKTINEDGNQEEIDCSEYIARLELSNNGTTNVRIQEQTATDSKE